MTLPSIPSLFVGLNNCRSHARVQIPGQSISKKQVDDHWLFGSRSMRYLNPDLPQNESQKKESCRHTASVINQIMENFQRNLGATRNQSNKTFTPTKLSEDNEPSAGAIRRLYRETIQADQKGINRSLGNFADDTEIVLTKNENGKAILSPLTEQEASDPDCTKNTILTYKALLVQKWGSKRVERALLRKKIDLSKKIHDNSPLKVSEMKAIVLGVNDFYLQDLNDCLAAIKNEITGNGTDPIPTHPRKKLKIALGCNEEADFLEKLSELFGEHTDLGYQQLPLALRSLIKDAVLANGYELELSFFGNRFEGVMDGGMKSFKDKFRANLASIDQQRLQIYQNILFHEHVEESDKQDYFDELLAKGLCKKELEIGMLIPSPWKSGNNALLPSSTSYYYVKDRILTGKGKFIYQLEPIDQENRQLESILLFRSTSSSPSTTDSASTILVDLFPFSPPGYLWRRHGDKKERSAYFASQRPLRLVGHSLGGSHAQLSLMHRIKKNKQWVDDLPDRQIRVVTFDSPKIKFSTARSFKKWSKRPESAPLKQKISIQHWISEGDIVPLAGEAYLGAYLSKGALAKNRTFTLAPEKSDSIYLSKNPHCRLFFHTRKNSDYTIKTSGETTRKNSLHLVEVIRRVFGFIIFPIVYVITWVWKKLFDGAELPSSFLNQGPLFTL
ncbi:lipase family protein [Estrella lausannensis]|uniref:Putative lipase n=1 Tax=Estrella lausannensis TaxID=483423 RepID=A0A0H5E4B2_9BACT|nr:hypothetical protein [Estrella lausannensis]CRX38060.1 Putative lipase [Estrella lausannensis]